MLKGWWPEACTDVSSMCLPTAVWTHLGSLSPWMSMEKLLGPSSGMMVIPSVSLVSHKRGLHTGLPLAAFPAVQKHWLLLYIAGELSWGWTSRVAAECSGRLRYSTSQKGRIQEVPPEVEKLTLRECTTGTSFPERLWSPSLEIFKPTWTLTCAASCREPALAGCWTRWSPEVPSNPYDVSTLEMDAVLKRAAKLTIRRLEEIKQPTSPLCET